MFVSKNPSKEYFRVRLCSLSGQLWHKVALFIVFDNTPNLWNLY